MSEERATLHEVVRLLSERGLKAAEVTTMTAQGRVQLRRPDGSDAPEKRLAAWRGDSAMVLPASRGSAKGMSAGCYCWLLAQEGDIPDRAVVRGLDVAATAKTEPDALKRLSGVVAWVTSGVRPSVDVLSRLIHRELTLKPRDRVGPDAATIKAWNRTDCMDGFSDWLSTRREPDWARQALRLVESALREVGLVPEGENVDAWIAQQPTPARARAAWKLYVEFCVEGPEPHPAAATPGRVGRPSGFTRPPDEVCDGVAVLVAAVGPTRVTQLRWSDLASKDDGALALNTRADSNAVATIEGDDVVRVEALRKWASCPDDGPLVPKRPGSMVAASARTVKRWAMEGVGRRAPGVR